MVAAGSAVGADRVSVAYCQSNGLGLLFGGLLVLVGFVLTVVQQDWSILIAATVPVTTWFVGCALQGMAQLELVERLTESEALLHELAGKDLLKLIG
jgi:hypothetical protein